ncbi:MAG TPA: putative toxin-antitoxin system toxin component, PIN family [Longimicrobium sp.]|nr:putative toxin-antitoxin system toxin component, PIN family [Longimicrobium sp.]
MRVVLDTNVVVSGLLSPGGPSGRILDLVAGGKLTVVYDDRIIGEYEEVLARPRLAIPVEIAATLLALIERTGVLVPAAPLHVPIPDVDDLPFLEVAAEGAAVLITGNRRHFDEAASSVGVTVVSPAEFLGLHRGERN